MEKRERALGHILLVLKTAHAILKKEGKAIQVLEVSLQPSLPSKNNCASPALSPLPPPDNLKTKGISCDITLSSAATGTQMPKSMGKVYKLENSASVQP